MAEGTIQKQLIDLDLFSGSSDAFRTAIGGFWYTVSSSEGSVVEFENVDSNSPHSGYFNKIASRADDSSYIKVVDSDIMIPNKKFPLRVYGESSTVKNDQFWKTIFLGGTFAELNYTALYSEKIFNYRYSTWKAPYPALSASLLSNRALSKIQISYDYNKYLPRYQTFGQDISSELLMPNYYILNDLLTYDTYEADADLFDPYLLKFVTREDTYSEINSLLNVNYSTLNSELTATGIEDFAPSNYALDLSNHTYLNTTYLTSSLPQVSLSSSTTAWVQNRLKNILLDREALQKLYVEDSIDSYSEQYPYYIKISFPLDDASDFCDSIKDNNFSSKFIKTLYMAFSDKIGALSPSLSQATLAENYYSGIMDSEAYYSVNKTATTTTRTIDYPAFLAYCHNTYSSSAENCLFIGGRNLARDCATMGGSGAYRYFNSVSSTEVLSDTIAYLSNSANFNISELSDIYGNNESEIETLAYRIEKIGGPPTGDGGTQNVLQNYWICNSDMQEDFDFFDTQTKYNTEYTYTVYAYKLICGFKYALSDLLLTKQLSCSDADGTYGLHFYDPLDPAEPSADQLYDVDTKPENLSELATMAFITSEHPYLADMYLSYEPSLQIVEVPVFSKTLKIVDNPPNECMQRPYQLIDNSQTIGFEVSLGAFADKTYPTSITSEDEVEKQKYLLANDLLPSEKLPRETVSRPRYIQIYRLSERPSAITDFAQSLISTIDAQIPNSKYPYTFKWFEDRIKTNQKYYYLFRVLNAQGTVGHISEIYEAELVNDGGYLYSVFNVIRESELEQKVFNNPAKSFKKLLQIRPRYNQTELEMSELQYSQEASSQVENLGVGMAGDLIWDRTFKFRLTSKKTGKKIDLNITYSLNSE